MPAPLGPMMAAHSPRVRVRSGTWKQRPAFIGIAHAQARGSRSTRSPERPAGSRRRCRRRGIHCGGVRRASSSRRSRRLRRPWAWRVFCPAMLRRMYSSSFSMKSCWASYSSKLAACSVLRAAAGRRCSCRGRPPGRGSSPRWCWPPGRGNSGRARRSAPPLANPPGNLPAIRWPRYPGDWSARPAAAGRGRKAAGGPAGRGCAARRRAGSAGGANRPG